MKRLLLYLLSILVIVSCGEIDPEPKKQESKTSETYTMPERNGCSGITYQLLVYSFADSDGDGIGDFNGIKAHIDHFRVLGVQALWLSPVHPSSSYHGYDVLDYTDVNPDYGTMDDFKALLAAAHSAGIKIYLDFVLNHTSWRHPWFLSAKASRESEYRDYYFFKEDGSYECFFDRSMPDINYGPATTCEQSEPFKELTAAADGWIRMGVDGFRLDAIKHIYDNAESDENPTFLKKFYDHCNTTYKSCGGKGDIYMIGEHFSEADKVAPYYTGLPAYFEFSFWWRLKDFINKGTGKDFLRTILGYRSLYAQYRDNYIAAPKLTNHDEDRAAKDLGRSKDKEKLAAAVLLTCSGEPYIYQGEELGYWGSKSDGDEALRAPMVWTSDISSIAGAKLHFLDMNMLTPEISVERQSADSTSVLSCYRKFGDLRARYRALSKGSMDNCPVSGNDAIAAWYRQYEDEKLLVLHNFSGGSTSVSITSADLSRVIAANGTVTVKESKVILGPYSSAIFLQ